MEKQILEIVLNIQANQIEMQKNIKDLQNGQKNLQIGQNKLLRRVEEIEERLDKMEAKQRIDGINIAKILEAQVEQFNSRIS